MNVVASTVLLAGGSVTNDSLQNLLNYEYQRGVFSIEQPFEQQRTLQIGLQRWDQKQTRLGCETAGRYTTVVLFAECSYMECTFRPHTGLASEFQGSGDFWMLIDSSMYFTYNMVCIFKYLRFNKFIFCLYERLYATFPT